jgi:hypothetical protein
VSLLDGVNVGAIKQGATLGHSIIPDFVETFLKNLEAAIGFPTRADFYQRPLAISEYADWRFSVIFRILATPIGTAKALRPEIAVLNIRLEPRHFRRGRHRSLGTHHGGS